MNEILKKKARKEGSILAYKEFKKGHECYNTIYDSFFKGVEFALSHQWIKVEESLPDRKEYDWVLIQIQMDDGFMCVPKIGEIRNDGYWHCAEYDELYKIGESFEKGMRCKVIAWMPIPKFDN